MTAAESRRRIFDQRMAVAPTDRERRHALVWWWLSEIKKLSRPRHGEEFERLKSIATALNEGRRP